MSTNYTFTVYLLYSHRRKHRQSVHIHKYTSTNSKVILIYLSSTVKQALFTYVNHSRIRSWNQPVLSNTPQGNNGSLWLGSNSRLTGMPRIRARHATHCATRTIWYIYIINLTISRGKESKNKHKKKINNV